MPTVEQAFDERAAAGTVLSQTPDSGTAGRGSTVKLVVSKGPDLQTVPKVVGLKRDEAEAALAAVGLKAQVVAIPGPGTVRSADPGEGSRVRKGAVVRLYVF